MPNVKTIFSDFFERNLFERIVIYIFLSEFFVKIIFELILGQWDFIQSQNIQWFFYGFLALDYVFSVRKVANIRVTINPMSLLAFVFFIMVAHGIFMGIMLRNVPFVILNDTIPLLMIGLNILRMQSVTEFKPLDIKSLIYFCTWVTVGTGLIGGLAESLGLPSGPSVPAEAIYYPLFLAAIFMIKPFPKWVALVGIVMIVITISDINRTTMAFCAIVVCGYTLISTVKNPAKGLISLILLVTVLTTGFYIMPEDSKTYRRIAGLADVDLSKNTGSIGERQAEWRAINKKFDRKGSTIEMLGLGFGGVYEVARTHEYLKNYGHAHYSWAWFKLRFGQIGYIYLFIFVSALIYNGFMWGLKKDENGIFMMFLCFISLLYCMTYVNATLLMMGMQFMYHRRFNENDDEKTTHPSLHLDYI